MKRTGFVLAGGQSSRMGVDKALLPVNGRLMVEWVVARLRPWVDRVCLIGSAQNIEDLRVVRVDAWLTDLAPDRGPLMGLYTGLMGTSTPLNLFAACDMPGIEPALLERLLGAWEDGIEAVGSIGQDDQLYPLPMVCHVSACRRIGAFLNQRSGSLRELMRGSAARVVRVPGAQGHETFMNVNTLADYARIGG